MSSDCLDCALFACDYCADEYGCCCGRIPPEINDDDYEQDEWDDA